MSERPRPQRIILLAAAGGLGLATAAVAGEQPTHPSPLTAAEIMRQAGLAAVVAGIVWLTLVEFVFRPRLGAVGYRWALLVGLLMLPAFALVAANATMLEDTKRVDSCASCHIMQPFVDDLRDLESATLAARHFREGWIPRDQCYACHTTYGAHGTLEAKRDGMRHWLMYATNTWPDPIRFRGSFPNVSCLSCHSGTPAYTVVPSHQALSAELFTDRVACISCHGPAHPPPPDRPRLRATDEEAWR